MFGGFDEQGPMMNRIGHTFRSISSRFERKYKAFSIVMMSGPERPEVNAGGKIIMPPSSLESLSRLNISFPMLFKIENQRKERTSHTGVLEFIADEGKVYLPGWMMRNLLLDEGDEITLTSTNLETATYGKFKPQQVEFLNITNPKAVLEKHLRTFACLSKHDVISIDYLGKAYELQIVETKPKDAVNIIECDMNVDFEAPVGYTEPERQAPVEEEPSPYGSAEMEEKLKHYYQQKVDFTSFGGKGARISGKKKGTKGAKNTVDLDQVYTRGVPNYDWNGKTLHFIRNGPAKETKEEEEDNFESFSGAGSAIRKKKSRN